MENKIIYTTMAKQFGLVDRNGKLPSVGDIAITGKDFYESYTIDKEIRFGIYKKEALDYSYDTYFDGCGFYLVPLNNESNIEGLGMNSKEYTFFSKKEYSKILEERTRRTICALESKKLTLDRKLEQARR